MKFSQADPGDGYLVEAYAPGSIQIDGRILPRHSTHHNGAADQQGAGGQHRGAQGTAGLVASAAHIGGDDDAQFGRQLGCRLEFAAYLGLGCGGSTTE